MTPHLVLDEESRELAALHSLELLGSAEAEAYEAHISECELCRAEVQTLRATLEELVLAAPAISPPPALRQRLLNGLSKNADAPRAAGIHAEGRGPGEPPRAIQTWKSWRAAETGGEFSFALASEGVWESTGVAGVEVRRLFFDPANDRATMLVRMAPGTAYPRHRHSGAEECYVIEGDLLVGDTRMKAGDYQRAYQGSIHGVQSTENGCLLLIVSSLGDEILPHDAV